VRSVVLSAWADTHREGDVREVRSHRVHGGLERVEPTVEASLECVEPTIDTRFERVDATIETSLERIDATIEAGTEVIDLAIEGIEAALTEPGHEPADDGDHDRVDRSHE
jgi:hypothetical protein